MSGRAKLTATNEDKVLKANGRKTLKWLENFSTQTSTSGKLRIHRVSWFVPLLLDVRSFDVRW